MVDYQHMPTPELLRDCEALALALAPEMNQAPLYATLLPPIYANAHSNNLAFTTAGSGIDFTIRASLIDGGQWRGPGTIVTFCQPLADDEALGLMLHEVAHKLPFAPPPADIEPTEELLMRQQTSMAASLSIVDIGKSPTMPAWYSYHGLDFVRRCLHLHYRAWQAGFEIGLPAMRFAGPLYDLSPAWKFMHALGDEPGRMQKATFAEIEATESPRKFRKLFNDDFQDWWTRKQSESTDKPASEVIDDAA